MSPVFNFNPALTIEDFGEEIIIVNLHNGAYFSLKGDACNIWRAMQSAATPDDLPAEISKKYTLDAPSLQRLGDLLLSWRNDELVIFEENCLAAITARPPAPLNSKPTLPALHYEKFTNMQDILLLDPIHDAGDLGWPHRNKP